MNLDSVIHHPWEFGFLTLLLLSLVMEVGYRTANCSHLEVDEDRKNQLIAMRDGLFVLVSLLLGFTLALAAQWYGERRRLLVDEANAIGTTYLRAGTLPSASRNQAQSLLLRYVDARLEFDDAGPDKTRAAAAVRHAKEVQAQLWDELVGITRDDRSAVAAAYMNSLNQLIDIHEMRLSALENRIPRSIWALILCISILAAFTRGLTLRHRFWLTLLIVPFTIAIVVALIADIDTPSSGLIRLDRRAMQRLKTDLSAASQAQTELSTPRHY
jgi:hypothetical protein